MPLTSPCCSRCSAGAGERGTLVADGCAEPVTEQDSRLRALTPHQAQAARARELAKVASADFVAWWVSGARAGELHMFDVRAGQLLGTRSVSRPLSPATAAALVRSIKTLLQTASPPASGVEPSSELPAPPSPTDASESGRDEAAAPQSSASVSRDFAGLQLPAPAPLSAAAPTTLPRAAGRGDAPGRPVVGSFVDLTLNIAVAEVERSAVAALGLGAVVWPRTVPVGLSVSARAAEPAVLGGAALRARLLDVALAADLALRLRPLPRRRLAWRRGSCHNFRHVCRSRAQL
jgi:hypothetical protein